MSKNVRSIEYHHGNLMAIPSEDKIGVVRFFEEGEEIPLDYVGIMRMEDVNDFIDMAQSGFDMLRMPITKQ